MTLDPTTRALIDAALNLKIYARLNGKYEVEDRDDLREFFGARMNYVAAHNTPDALEASAARCAALEKALRRIAFEPQGPADATHAEVLSRVEAIAKEAL